MFRRTPIAAAALVATIVGASASAQDDEPPVRSGEAGAVYQGTRTRVISSRRSFEETSAALREQLSRAGMQVAARVAFATYGEPPPGEPQVGPGAEPDVEKGGAGEGPAGRGEIVFFTRTVELREAGDDPMRLLERPHEIVIYEDPAGSVYLAYHPGPTDDLAPVVEKAADVETLFGL